MVSTPRSTYRPNDDHNSNTASTAHCYENPGYGLPTALRHIPLGFTLFRHGHNDSTSPPTSPSPPITEGIPHPPIWDQPPKNGANNAPADSGLSSCGLKKDRNHPNNIPNSNSDSNPISPPCTAFPIWTVTHGAPLYSPPLGPSHSPYRQPSCSPLNTHLNFDNNTPPDNLDINRTPQHLGPDTGPHTNILFNNNDTPPSPNTPESHSPYKPVPFETHYLPFPTKRLICTSLTQISRLNSSKLNTKQTALQSISYYTVQNDQATRGQRDDHGTPYFAIINGTLVTMQELGLLITPPIFYAP